MSKWSTVRRRIGLKLIHLVCLIRPDLSTKLSVWYYSGCGMTIDQPPGFISFDAWFDSTHNYRPIHIGAGAAISQNVRVLTHDWSPNTAFQQFGRGTTRTFGRVAPVRIGEFAFIGMGAILMPGTTIGRGAIVGAGAVVRGDVAPGTIVAGNPAVVVGRVADYLERNYPDDWAVYGVASRSASNPGLS